MTRLPATVAWADSAFTVTAALDNVVCRFPRRSLTVIFNEHTRLAALFFAIVRKLEELHHIAQWTDRFERLDTSWFPAAG